MRQLELEDWGMGCWKGSHKWQGDGCAGELPSSPELFDDDADLALLLSRFRRADGGPARSIAVIGSSGTLLNTGLGALIDAHDVEIRFNDAPTQGLEEDVGHDSHQLRVGWSVSLEKAAKKGFLCCGVLTVRMGACTGRNACPAKMAGLHDGAKAAIHAIEQETGERASVALAGDFQHRCHAILGYKGNWPSTGWMGLCMAVAVGRLTGANISVFGYGACRCIRYVRSPPPRMPLVACLMHRMPLTCLLRCRAQFDCHAVDDTRGEAKGQNTWHPFATEAETRRLWASQGAIALYEPDCEHAVVFEWTGRGVHAGEEAAATFFCTPEGGGAGVRSFHPGTGYYRKKRQAFG